MRCGLLLRGRAGRSGGGVRGFHGKGGRGAQRAAAHPAGHARAARHGGSVRPGWCSTPLHAPMHAHHAASPAPRPTLRSFPPYADRTAACEGGTCDTPDWRLPLAEVRAAAKPPRLPPAATWAAVEPLCRLP